MKPIVKGRVKPLHKVRIKFNEVTKSIICSYSLYEHNMITFVFEYKDFSLEANARADGITSFLTCVCLDRLAKDTTIPIRFGLILVTD